MDIISAMLDCLGAIPAVRRYYRNNSSELKLYLSAVKIRYFYPSSVIKTMLCRYNYKDLPDSKFIDYSLAIEKKYYQNDILRIKILKGGKEREVLLPYKEEINYVLNPESRISIADYSAVPFQLSHELEEQTKNTLDEYLKVKPSTTNRKTLRLIDFQCFPGRNEYRCKLQAATYQDQVRTNLTLDVPLWNEDEKTIRIIDLSPDKSLKSLCDSVMANTIGVSAVWYMSNKNGDKKNRLQFFLKPRQNSIGVFANMLGTTSGVVEPPTGEMGEEFLEEYVKGEMMREFFEETGYGNYMRDKNIPLSDIKITMLAFSRELMRGGKPQFFFLIKTPYISNKEFCKYFKRSIDGRNEFKDGTLSNLFNCQLSPETVMNYLYAFQYMQKEQFVSYGHIDIDA